MGEYIRVGGEIVKLGTCEDLYYTTFEELRLAVLGGACEREPGDLAPAEYLNPANGFRYRFPFPDEDYIMSGCLLPGRRLPDGFDYQRGVLVAAPMRMVSEVAHLPDFCARLRVGCPFGNPGLAVGGLQPAVEVTQQKQVEGALWVVVRCPFCGALWRVNPDDGAALVAAIRAGHGGDRLRELIADRIAEGYGGYGGVRG
jgi:hypothetical protein